MLLFFWGGALLYIVYISVSDVSLVTYIYFIYDPNMAAILKSVQIDHLLEKSSVPEELFKVSIKLHEPNYASMDISKTSFIYNELRFVLVYRQRVL